MAARRARKWPLAALMIAPFAFGFHEPQYLPRQMYSGNQMSEAAQVALTIVEAFAGFALLFAISEWFSEKSFLGGIRNGAIASFILLSGAIPAIALWDWMDTGDSSAGFLALISVPVGAVIAGLLLAPSLPLGDLKTPTKRFKVKRLKTLDVKNGHP